jgi:hypothetical protein
MDMSWLKTIAPTVASALGGPLAGIAVTALGSALGWTDTTKEKVTDMLQSGNMTGEQLTAVKQAELVLKQHESDNNFKFAELEIRDRESARAREIATKDTTPTILAWIIIGTSMAAGMLILSGTTSEVFKDATTAATAGTVIGYLFNEAKQVLAYYFGSSAGSKAKDDVIADQVNNSK